MPSRSRKTAWALAWGVGIAVVGNLVRAEDPPPAVANTVTLNLQISGVGQEEFQVEIKPAHPGCSFEPVVRKVEKVPTNGVVRFEPIEIDAQSRSADRDFAMAITIKAPDGSDLTFKRAIRLLPEEDGKPIPTRSMTCYLRTTTVASKNPPKDLPK